MELWHESFGSEAQLLLSLEQAEQFDWFRHSDRLCSVTSGVEFGVCCAYIAYHSQHVNSQRIIVVKGKTNDFGELRGVYKKLDEVIDAHRVMTLRLNYSTGMRIKIPFTHFKSVKISPKKFSLRSCQAKHFEKVSAGDEMPSEKFQTAARILKAFSRWKEEQEFLKKAGPKRRIDEAEVEEMQGRTKFAK